MKDLDNIIRKSRIILPLAFAAALAVGCENIQQGMPTSPTPSSTSAGPSGSSGKKSESKKESAPTVHGYDIGKEYIDLKLKPAEEKPDENFSMAVRSIVEHLKGSYKAYPDEYNAEEQITAYRGSIVKGKKETDVGKAAAYEWSAAKGNRSYFLEPRKPSRIESFNLIVFESGKPGTLAYQVVEKGRTSSLGNGSFVPYTRIAAAGFFENGKVTSAPVAINTFKVIK